MAYSIERAGLIAAQLEKFAHAQVHQIAGQLANLDFWLDEAAAALRVLDDYQARFRALRDAQVAWVKRHGTMVSDYCPHCDGGCEFGPRPPDPPRRIPSEDLDGARLQVRRAAYRLLLRYHRVRLLTEAEVQAACDRLGVTLEREDLAER
jgi:hypothetical protein